MSAALSHILMFKTKSLSDILIKKKNTKNNKYTVGFIDKILINKQLVKAHQT